MLFRPDPARKLSENLYDVYHCCVYSEKTPDDGHRNCPKHVEFYSKNKFEKLVHLVGFIIRIFHEARSPECQILLGVEMFYCLEFFIYHYGINYYMLAKNYHLCFSSPYRWLWSPWRRMSRISWKIPLTLTECYQGNSFSFKTRFPPSRSPDSVRSKEKWAQFLLTVAKECWATRKTVQSLWTCTPVNSLRIVWNSASAVIVNTVLLL